MSRAQPRTAHIRVDGRSIAVDADTSLAVALMNAGKRVFRVSRTGEPRGPVCGMGVCFECRVTVDGRPHIRSCIEPVRDGMEVETSG